MILVSNTRKENALMDKYREKTDHRQKHDSQRQRVPFPKIMHLIYKALVKSFYEAPVLWTLVKRAILACWKWEQQFISVHIKPVNGWLKAEVSLGEGALFYSRNARLHSQLHVNNHN